MAEPTIILELRDGDSAPTRYYCTVECVRHEWLFSGRWVQGGTRGYDSLDTPLHRCNAAVLIAAREQLQQLDKPRED